MTYSNKIKEEILNVNVNNEDEVIGEIFGILFSKNYFHREKINFSTESVSLLKRVYTFLKRLLNREITVNTDLKRNGIEKSYEISLIPNGNDDGILEILNKLNSLKNIKMLNDELIKSVIRGFFLTSGYVKSPEKAYSIDFFLENGESAKYLYDLLKKIGKRVFKVKKGDKYVVYLRNSEDILDVIFMIGGINSFFEFEEITINKEIRNKINRTINWEIANEAKKFTTAEKQLNIIQKIDEEMGLENLSNVLREAAEIRLKNEEASLQELADIIGVSKSGIRNRFRRLEELYNSLNLEKKD